MNSGNIEIDKQLKGNCAAMINDLEGMSGDCDVCTPFMRGQKDAEQPPPEKCIHKRTNPEFNGAWEHIEDFFLFLRYDDVVKRCWFEIMKVLDRTYKYIDKLEMMFPAREFEISKTAVKRLENLLKRRQDGKVSDEQYLILLDKCRMDWHDSFEDNAHACYERFEDVREQRKEADDDILKRFPGFHPGKYILGVLDGCDMDKCCVGVHRWGNFYMPYSGASRWKIIRVFVEAKSEDGYVDMKPYGNWQSLFQSSNSPRPPKGSEMDFVGGPFEFFSFIHGIDRTSLFRIESTPRRRI